jgi:hypothetical protein
MVRDKDRGQTIGARAVKLRFAASGGVTGKIIVVDGKK